MLIIPEIRLNTLKWSLLTFNRFNIRDCLGTLRFVSVTLTVTVPPYYYESAPGDDTNDILVTELLLLFDILDI